MNSRLQPSRRLGPWALSLLVFTVALAPARPALAGDDDALAIQRAESLNKRASEDYDMLEFEGAQRALSEALATLKKAGLDQHPVAAKTNLQLGVVYVAGFKDRYKGFQHFVKALQISPELELDRGVATPELREVFQNARDSVGGRGPKAPTSESGGGGDVKGLVHQPIDDAPPGAAIHVKASVGRELRAAKLVLHYRPQGREDFQNVPMARGGDGVYAGEIPATAVAGKSLQYYVEVKDGGGKTVASSGTAASPNIITIAAPKGAGGEPGDKENPLAGDEKKKDDGTPGGKSWWFTIGVGTGAGLATGDAEVARGASGRAVPVNTGVAPSLFHVAPEVGFYLNEQWALALQGRFQVGAISEQKGGASGAPSVLLRALYFLRKEGFQPYVGFNAGGGQIRHRVDLTGAVPSDQAKIDTTVAGPALFGPAAGFHTELGKTMHVMFDVNALIGAPKFTANLDLNIGLGFVF